MVKLRKKPDVGDGDITKELHRTIQFSKTPVKGESLTVEKNLESGLWKNS